MHVAQSMLVVDGDKRQIIVICQVGAHGFEIRNDHLGCKGFEDILSQGVQRAVAVGQLL